MNVTVVGTGYIGLVAAACLAERGHRVTCVDTDAARLAAIEAGRAPFHEPGLDDLVAAGRAAGRLRTSGDLAAAVTDSALSMVAVGTPSTGGAIDLRFVDGAVAEIGEALRRHPGGHVVAIKSTVVPGTTVGPVRRRLEASSGQPAGRSWGLAMNPEFTREGCAVRDFLEPDRIVIGHADPRARAVMDELYAPFDCPKLFTSPTNAEMIKYAANALLATLVSFGNEIAGLCEVTPDADAELVMRGVTLDRRCRVDAGGTTHVPELLAYLRAGIGFGGSCLPKDVQALSAYGRRATATTALLDAVLTVNGARAAALVRQADAALGGLRGREIAVLGLAFKPGTDDVRDSPAAALIERLLGAGAAVRAYDPVATRVGDGETLAQVRRCASVEEALGGADAALLATAWPEFAALDWARLVPTMRRPVVGDGRGLLAAIDWPAAVTYFRVGKML
jgi:UDPglucose 6-dehydrogenase/GDP-mannose 6-dehydrogenase